jgi:hypothetical protein
MLNHYLEAEQKQNTIGQNKDQLFLTSGHLNRSVCTVSNLPISTTREGEGGNMLACLSLLG